MSIYEPNKEVHKLLISTPAHFVGEYNSHELNIKHSWEQFEILQTKLKGMQEDPTSRTFLAVLIKEKIEDGHPLPQHYGDFTSNVLAVLFGKRFDYHGLVESGGYFFTPRANWTTPLQLKHFGPFNSKPRRDLEIDLNLKKTSLIHGLITANGPEDWVRRIFIASRFYNRALQAIEDDSEIAYLNLVNAGEILSYGYEYSDDQLYDESVREVLDKIRTSSEDGEHSYKVLKGRIHGISRRYFLTLHDSLNENFFLAAEAGWSALKRENIKKVIKGSYNLRSRYLHDGITFGSFIYPDSPRSEWSNIGNYDLAEIPTFIGLERIIRYALLRSIHKYISPIDSRLD